MSSPRFADLLQVLSGHEVDFIVELGAKRIAVEAKSGQTIADDFFDGLRYWRELAGRKAAQAALNKIKGWTK